MVDVQYDFSAIFTEPIQRLDRIQLLRFNPRKYWAVEKAIDKMGELSTKAQGLKRVITSYQKMLDHEEEQIIYIMWKRSQDKENMSQLIGILKVGRKKLYLRDAQEQPFEEKPLCILDFYVNEPLQRRGRGHELYEFMLQSECISAHDIAIDKPSDAFLQFLEKYYSLSKPLWQSTNFVVFPSFFKDKTALVSNELKEEKRRGARSAKMSSDDFIPSPAQPRDSASGIIHGTGSIFNRQ
ncbi:hypothetical protein WR25_12566 [Diploscapter pachys]|uniref:Alpha-tubulin N-acetyltransferase n=1 Tax=Diploscapter pachys TaxID=2018661 RepID=A0A2A2KTB7_9BILA|nr:hypothetical protein WR25_12566 [Diploscapter pachys]